MAKILGPRSPPGLREETGLHRLDEDPVRVVSETLQVDAAGAYLFSYLLKVEPDGFSDALCRTYAPMLPAHRTVSHLRIEYPTLFRKPLQFIVIAVMSVMSGTFPYTYRVSTSQSIPGVFGDRHVIVTLTVTEETPYLSGLLATVTAMTLMTVIWGPISRQGALLYFVGSLTPSI